MIALRSTAVADGLVFHWGGVNILEESWPSPLAVSTSSPDIPFSANLLLTPWKKRWPTVLFQSTVPCHVQPPNRLFLIQHRAHTTEQTRELIRCLLQRASACNCPLEQPSCSALQLLCVGCQVPFLGTLPQPTGTHCSHLWGVVHCQPLCELASP